MSAHDSHRRQFAKWHVDLAIHEALAIARTRRLEFAFCPLLAAVIGRTAWLRTLPLGGQTPFEPPSSMLRALLALAEFGDQWLRDVDDWRPIGDCRYEQFASLASFLLARRPVPPFMMRVWFEEPSPEARQHQTLFKHLGWGNSIRGADVPLRLNKAMAGHFMQAPAHLTVEQALRYSQVRGLGGAPQMALAIAASRLGETFANQRFWNEVIGLLISSAGIELELVKPLIDFFAARASEFAGRPLRMSRCGIERMKTRVRQWLVDNPDCGTIERQAWQRTSIGGLRYREAGECPWSVRCWTIRELLDSQQLLDEGRAMRHCVGGYATACQRRATSIWSLRREGALASQRVLTIEVSPRRRRIITALGRCNSDPRPEARRVLRRWAEQEGLSMSPLV